MWCDTSPSPPTRLPRTLAVPWAHAAALLDMPPVLVYATYNLLNWRRVDARQGLRLGNLLAQRVRSDAW